MKSVILNTFLLREYFRILYNYSENTTIDLLCSFTAIAWGQESDRRGVCALHAG